VLDRTPGLRQAARTNQQALPIVSRRHHAGFGPAMRSLNSVHASRHCKVKGVHPASSASQPHRSPSGNTRGVAALDVAISCGLLCRRCASALPLLAHALEAAESQAAACPRANIQIA
jgi:hypothetical protein